jgi:hypothetical protein
MNIAFPAPYDAASDKDAPLLYSFLMPLLRSRVICGLICIKNAFHEAVNKVVFTSANTSQKFRKQMYVERPVLQQETSVTKKNKNKGHSCTGTEALYRRYGP